MAKNSGLSHARSHFRFFASLESRGGAGPYRSVTEGDLISCKITRFRGCPAGHDRRHGVAAFLESWKLQYRRHHSRRDWLAVKFLFSSNRGNRALAVGGSEVPEGSTLLPSPSDRGYRGHIFWESTTVGPTLGFPSPSDRGYRGHSTDTVQVTLNDTGCHPLLIGDTVATWFKQLH